MREPWRTAGQGAPSPSPHPITGAPVVSHCSRTAPAAACTCGAWSTPCRHSQPTSHQRARVLVTQVKLRAAQDLVSVVPQLRKDAIEQARRHEKARAAWAREREELLKRFAWMEEQVATAKRMQEVLLLPRMRAM